MRLSICLLTLLLTSPLYSQNLEVEGNARITVLDKVNTADSVVVRLPDGTLAFRDASTLASSQVLSISNDTIFLSACDNCHAELITGLNFAGDNDYVEILNNAALAPTTTNVLTFEAWVKPESNDHFYIASMYNNGDAGTSNFFIRRNADGSITVTGNGTNVVTSPSTIPLNTWTHIAVILNPGVNNTQIYINGVLDQSGTLNYNPSNGGQSFFLGLLTFPPSFFKGTLDEVRIWQGTRSGAQIRNNLPVALKGNEAGLLAYYDCNEGVPGGSNVTLTDLMDKAGNNYHGTLNNFQKNGEVSNWVMGAPALGGLLFLKLPDASMTNEIQNLMGVLLQDSSAGNHRITDLRDPADPQDASTKNYLAVYVGQKMLKFKNSLQGDVCSVIPVTSVTGQVWMDRNLGADKAGGTFNDYTDEATWGDLYQWGRAADGHQDRRSGTFAGMASSSIPIAGNAWDGLFIASPSSDWLNPQDANLWQGVNGINNPCPSGYRLPTEAEWAREIPTWVTYCGPVYGNRK